MQDIALEYRVESPVNISPQHLSELPLFPLAEVVFFPGTMLPLHVFEPRYREMTRFCIDNGWPLAVVLIQPGYEKRQSGNPPLSAVAGVGDVVFHRETPDGRYHIVLRGLAKVRLVRELPRTAAFRRAQTEILPDFDRSQVYGVDDQMETLRHCLVSLRDRWPGAKEVVDEMLTEDIDPGNISNVLSSVLFSDAGQRQKLLTCRDVGDRLESVIGRLTQILASIPRDTRMAN